MNNDIKHSGAQKDKKQNTDKVPKIQKTKWTTFTYTEFLKLQPFVMFPEQNFVCTLCFSLEQNMLRFSHRSTHITTSLSLPSQLLRMFKRSSRPCQQTDQAMEVFCRRHSSCDFLPVSPSRGSRGPLADPAEEEAQAKVRDAIHRVTSCQSTVSEHGLWDGGRGTTGDATRAMGQRERKTSCLQAVWTTSRKSVCDRDVMVTRKTLSPDADTI
jgi:hypothetical protein